MVHKLIHALTLASTASLTVAYHTTATPDHHHYSASSLNAAFVYTKRSQAIAVSDSLRTRVLYSGDVGTGRDNFLTQDSRYLVVRSSTGDVSTVDVTTGAVTKIDCPCDLTAPKPGEGNTIYWLAAGGTLTQLTLGADDAKPETVQRLNLPDPPPDPDKQVAANLAAKLVAVTKDGYLLSRMDYQSGLTSFGNPNVLYFASRGGHIIRLGPVAANTVADQYIVGQGGHDVLYSANSHVSNGCTSAVLGSVSTGTGTATASTVDLPAAQCSHIANMWPGGRGETFVLMTTWDDRSANPNTAPQPILLKYSNGVAGNTGSPPVWESASNGPAVATITQSDQVCGNLTVEAPGRPAVADSGVCRVMATDAAQTTFS